MAYKPSMKGIEMKYAIVHIADIHYKSNEPEGVSSVLNLLLEDLIHQRKVLADYTFFIGISGDIVFSGSETTAYENFKLELDKGLENVGLPSSTRFLVPGNHDLDRKVIEKNFEKYKTDIENNSTSESDFNNFVDRTEDYKFENYELFECEFADFGIDCNTKGKGWEINSDLGVYCLNTALCSFGGLNGIDDEKKLAIYTRGVIEWCKQKATKTNILLMHHPLEYLNKWSQAELKKIIEEHFSLCLCGHCHQQDLKFNQISQKSLVCSAPQLFTNKYDDLGYAIITINDHHVTNLIYREYVNGKFLNGSKFSGNDSGIVDIQNGHNKNKAKLKANLDSALSFFKDQSKFFIKPKLSKDREFNDEDNLIDTFIESPMAAFIIAHPQFGLTCLSHYMRLEAYKNGNFWIYLDANHTKARKAINDIELQLQDFGENKTDICCIIIDSWDDTIVDHHNILKLIDEYAEDIPIVIMSAYSSYSYSTKFDFTQLNSKFMPLHLQALQRTKVRELVSKYNQTQPIAEEDDVVAKVVKDLETLNVHRTPLNCLTLLKVFEKGFNDDLINRTKLIKTVLFILFTNAESFTYSSTKPEVEDCEYILGRFCKNLIQNHTRSFDPDVFKDELYRYCQEKLVTVDISAIIDILESNNIIIKVQNKMEFKHRYWVFYFAAKYMQQDESFRNYILTDKNYINYPEIIEFYTGIDGKKDDAIKVLLKDTKELVSTVDQKIGIPEDFNPFKGIVWDLSKDKIHEIRKEISEKVQKSKLPNKIKDQHADNFYDSEVPYDQSITNFLTDYSVISLIQSIKAASRALRNSTYIEPENKLEMLQTILGGWEQVSRVLFWLSPTLAQRGRATYDGLNVILDDSFKGSPEEKLKHIYIANPNNVVTHFKDNISSKKIGPVFFKNLKENTSEMQKHFVSLLLIKEQPDGWFKEVTNHMNLLHRTSFYLGDIYNTIRNEIDKGYNSDNSIHQLRNLLSVVCAKQDVAPKISKSNKGNDTKESVIDEKNKLKVDKIIASRKKDHLYEFLKKKDRSKRTK
nr:metallophosphoesterase [uncultured Desulfobacter sp.]